MYSLPDFIKIFEPRFQDFLQKKNVRYSTYTQDQNILAYLDHILAYATGGKRLRPYMIYLGYCSRGNDLTDSIWDFLLAIELIHLFALIHDDIADLADERRGTPSMHIKIQSLLGERSTSGNIEHNAFSQAMLVGDIVLWQFFEVLMRPKDSDVQSIAQQIHPKIIQLLDEVVIGQMIDLDISVSPKASLERILEKTKLKTAQYSFGRPIEIGALLAQEEDDYVTTLGKIGTDIGIAFQIQDDYLDIMADQNKLKKDLFSDIAEGQHTVFSQYIFENGNDAQKALLKSTWKSRLPQNRWEEFRTLFSETGALTFGLEKMQEYFDRARNQLDNPSLPSPLKDKLEELISTIQHRTS